MRKYKIITLKYAVSCDDDEDHKSSLGMEFETKVTQVKNKYLQRKFKNEYVDRQLLDSVV